MNWYQRKKLKALPKEQAEAAVKEKQLQERMAEIRYKVLKEYRDREFGELFDGA